MRAIGLDRPIRPAGHSVSVEMTSSIHSVPTVIAGTSRAETGRRPSAWRYEGKSENQSAAASAVLELVRAEQDRREQIEEGGKGCGGLLTSLSIGLGIYLVVLAGFLGWWARFPR